MSRETLAKRFGRPVPTIKTWLHRSLAQLRDCLKSMTISPDDDFAAAEYVLGTLDGSERATLAARRLREPELDEAIRGWEARWLCSRSRAGDRAAGRPFSPRSRRASEGRRPNRRWAGRSSPLSEASAWRTTAIAASVVAAVLAIGFVARETSRGAAPREYVAILQKDAASPAFEVTVNLDKQELTVRPVSAQVPPGKSYELWIIDAKLAGGRWAWSANAARRELSAYEPSVVANATYAVTAEPPGGSPTASLRAPAFVGKLISGRALRR